MKIAFLGLGIMGSRMASNLLKNSVDLTVHNRSKAPIIALEKEGAKVADSAVEAVADADLVFSMLSTPEVVETLFFGEDGCLAAMKKNALWVDCTTVNPSFSILAGKEAQKYGIRFVDAPVAGTKPQAQNAELVYFVGGENSVVNEIEPILKYMGNKVVHIGETGKGASFKMLVNMMVAQSMLIFSEAVLLGEKMGIAKDFLLDILPNLVVAAPFTKSKAELIRADDYDVQFPLEWMHKDLHLAAITAYENKQPLYLVNLAKELYADANKSGLSRLDFAAIYKFLERKNQQD
ncbi:MAG: NAD(P)-dependent oxidoreductase [Calditrichaeota bacterium]|nr:MAG: NAD(P)-dependent oxidoreductase [Calditrichota bacterium]